MDRPASRRHPQNVRCLTAIVMLAALLMAAATGSQAGIRDLAKSAKDKAAKATGQKSETAAPAVQQLEFDDTMLELTGDLIDKLVAARKKSAAAASGRPALVQRREANRKEADDLGFKNGDAITANRDQRSNAQSCIQGALTDIQGKKQQAEMQKMMADPRSAEKVLKLTAAMNDAQLKGDQAEMARLQKQMEGLYAATHADSVAAEKQCGPMPPLLPAAARLEALDDELPKLDEKIRDMDMKAMKIQTESSGLTAEQVAMCWERIEKYLAKLEHDANPWGFSAVELKALSEHKDALKAAFAG